MFTAQIHESVYRITTPYESGGVVFLYLVRGDSQALIDTGVTDSPRQVLDPALAEIGMRLSDVDLVLNTHGHLDHAGGNAAVKSLAPGARINIHSADVPLATDLEYEIDFHVAPLRALDFPRSFIDARSEYVARTAGPDKVPADSLLREGEDVDLGRGVRLRVLHVPGHTPGHVALFWEAERILFTSDAVQGQGSRPGGFPYYFDASSYRRSLARIADLDYDTLGMGHGYIGGGPISDATRTGEDARAFLQESIRIADAIDFAVSAAIRRMPGVPRRQIALAALDDLLFEVPQVRRRATQMPPSGGPALGTHIEAALAGTYPS